jgi:hypothetical protein
VYGESTADNASGLYGFHSGLGFGTSGRGHIGVYGVGSNIGVLCRGYYGLRAQATEGGKVAGIFDGDVNITRDVDISGGLTVGGPIDGGPTKLLHLTVTGPIFKLGGGFRIDHPADPDNKYLTHSFVESPDMKNVYDGVAVLNARGEAAVKLPTWFEMLNRDFRYQLTAIGTSAPNLHIARGIEKNVFKVAGGKPKMKVSWQVTGIRKDRWAEKNRIQVEEGKPAHDRGHYLDPQLYGKPRKKSVQKSQRAELMELMRKAAKGSKPAKRGKTSFARKFYQGRGIGSLKRALSEL